jgi:hypothetical protein
MRTGRASQRCRGGSRVQQVDDGPAHAVQPPEIDVVVPAFELHRLGHPGPFLGFLRAGKFVDEDVVRFHAGLHERVDLHAGVLVGGGKTRVSAYR